MESRGPATSSAWYAVRVKPRFERFAARNFDAKGIEHLLPIHRIRRRTATRVQEIELPLFPGYVFARFDIQDRLRVLNVPGVLTVVGFGNAGVPIHDREIGNLGVVTASSAQFESWPYVAVGEAASVEHGPLAGLEGIVVQIQNRHRLVVSISMLQRSVAVEVDREWLRPVKRTPRPAGSSADAD